MSDGSDEGGTHHTGSGGKHDYSQEREASKLLVETDGDQEVLKEQLDKGDARGKKTNQDLDDQDADYKPPSQ